MKEKEGGRRRRMEACFREGDLEMPLLVLAFTGFTVQYQSNHWKDTSEELLLFTLKLSVAICVYRLIESALTPVQCFHYTAHTFKCAHCVCHVFSFWKVAKVLYWKCDKQTSKSGECSRQESEEKALAFWGVILTVAGIFMEILILYFKSKTTWQQSVKLGYYRCYSCWIPDSNFSNIVSIGC